MITAIAPTQALLHSPLSISVVSKGWDEPLLEDMTRTGANWCKCLTNWNVVMLCIYCTLLGS